MDEDLITGLSIVKSSLNKRKILYAIGNYIKTPSELSKETKVRLNHTSMYLTDLKTTGLVECLNEDSKKGRLYRLTDLGKRVLKMLG